MLMIMTLSLTFTRRNFSLVLRYYELFVVLKIPFSHRKVIEGENNYCIFFFIHSDKHLCEKFVLLDFYTRDKTGLIALKK